MKKLLPLILFILSTPLILSQNSAPNGNFELWSSGTYNYPQYYQWTSNEEAFMMFNLPFNVTRSTDSYHGTYAVHLTTLSTAKDSVGAYFVNSSTTDGDNWHGGVPYTEIPTGFRGYYKYNVATVDSALVLAAFSKAGVNIGTYFFKVGGIKTDYTLFEFTFDPPLAIAPDSVMFGATSSDLLTEIVTPGSTLIIDSVSFTGVTSQPAMLNGDFESWLSNTLYRPESWHPEREGTERTTDSYSGIYAAKLTTMPGFENNLPSVHVGRISTGYYSNSCNCMMGGYPYTSIKDTLQFYYKYTPSVGTDSANVDIEFKKNGVTFGWAGTRLKAASSYTYAEVPFELGQTPDSVIVGFQSSQWTNKDPSYAGAVLLVDEVYFKSQLITTNVQKEATLTEMTVYPNPTEGRFSISQDRETSQSASVKVEIFNSIGLKVKSMIISDQKTDIDISEMPKGVYYLRIVEGQKVRTEKLIKR